MAGWQPRVARFGKAAVLVRDFRLTLLLVAIVLGLCVATQVALDSGAVQLSQLSASRANPMGVILSVFAHYDWAHLSANAEGLAFFAGAFIFTNIPLSSTERARRSRWFALISYPLAVSVNVVYITLAPGSSSGASGLVYAAFGVSFVFFVINASEGAVRFATLIRAARDDVADVRPMRHAFWWLGMNVTLVAVFLYLIEFNLPLLFGVGYSGINAFAHLLGFLLAFLLSMVWSYAPQHRSSAVG